MKRNMNLNRYKVGGASCRVQEELCNPIMTSSSVGRVVGGSSVRSHLVSLLLSAPVDIRTSG